MCARAVPTGDHHRVVDNLRLHFWFLVIVSVKGVSFFYCQLYFLDRFFSSVVFMFWFTCWLDIFDSKACLTSRMQIFN